MDSNATAIVLAAGRGERIGGDVAKPFLEIGGRTLLAHSIDRLRSSEVVREIVVVVSRPIQEWLGPNWEDRLKEEGADRTVLGGARRQDSSFAGFEAADENSEIILVHDAVRPFVSPALVRKVAEAAAEYGAAVPAMPAVDSVKEGVGGFLVRSIPRALVYLTQTPQGFRRSLMARMFKEVAAADIDVSDDAEMAEIAGIKVKIVPGERLNLKVTEPEDVTVARILHRELES